MSLFKNYVRFVYWCPYFRAQVVFTHLHLVAHNMFHGILTDYLFVFQSSKAIKQLIANHRLILSGTPIQNNVLELWSLFDFLMPGFLGTEKQFTARYSRPILASRDPKSSHTEQEAGKYIH